MEKIHAAIEIEQFNKEMEKEVRLADILRDEKYGISKETVKAILKEYFND